MMSHKGTRHSTTGNYLQHWRFNFQKVRAIQVAANKVDNRRADAEGIAHFRINNQINIALAVTHFLIGQTMKLIWQWTQCFGQQLIVVHLYIEIAFTRLVQRTGNTNDITEIDRLGKGTCLFGDIQLDGARAVLNHHKRTAVANNSTGDTNNFAQLLQRIFGFFTKAGLQFRSTVLWTEVIGERCTFLLTEFGEFGTAFGYQLIFVLLISHF